MKDLVVKKSRLIKKFYIDEINNANVNSTCYAFSHRLSKMLSYIECRSPELPN